MGLPLAKMTLVEFLAWEETQTARHEFFHGETFAMAGGTSGHNRVVVNLTRRIDTHLDGSDCQVFSENMKVKVEEKLCFYPDLMVTCGQTFKGDELTTDDAVLIIEVLSPSTGGYDKRDKFFQYRRLSSLRQYVLIDPATRDVEVFTRAEAGAWMLTDHGQQDHINLSSIGFELPLEWVFKGVESEAA